MDADLCGEGKTYFAKLSPAHRAHALFDVLANGRRAHFSRSEKCKTASSLTRRRYTHIFAKRKRVAGRRVSDELLRSRPVARELLCHSVDAVYVLNEFCRRLDNIDGTLCRFRVRQGGLSRKKEMIGEEDFFFIRKSPPPNPLSKRTPRQHSLRTAPSRHVDCAVEASCLHRTMGAPNSALTTPT